MTRIITTLGVIALAGTAGAQTVGFTETFNAGTAGFGGGSGSYTTPLGGADGAADGYLEVGNSFVGSLGTRNAGANLTGDYTAASVTAIQFALSDTGADDDHNIYLGVGTAFSNFWIYNAPFTPTDGAWTTYTVPIADDGNWVQIIGAGSLADAFSNSNRLLFRHDAIGFPAQSPEGVAGEFGLDNVTLLPTPGAAGLLAIGALGAMRRRR